MIGAFHRQIVAIRAAEYPENVAPVRLYFSRRALYSDLNPGNFLFRKDGHLGWMDFGGMRRFSDAEWALLREAHEAANSTDGSRVLGYIQRSLMFSDQEMQSRANIVELVEEWVNIYWEPLRAVGPFDYGDPDFVHRVMTLWNWSNARSSCIQGRIKMKSLRLWVIAAGLLAGAVAVQAVEKRVGRKIGNFSLQHDLGTKHLLRIIHHRLRSAAPAGATCHAPCWNGLTTTESSVYDRATVI